MDGKTYGTNGERVQGVRQQTWRIPPGVVIVCVDAYHHLPPRTAVEWRTMGVVVLDRGRGFQTFLGAAVRMEGHQHHNLHCEVATFSRWNSEELGFILFRKVNIEFQGIKSIITLRVFEFASCVLPEEYLYNCGCVEYSDFFMF